MKRWFIGGLASLFLAFGLLGCASQQLSDYAGETPALDLETFFVGRTEAWGMFQDRSGTVVRRFHVTIDGRMEDGRLILDEDFLYNDGERDRRIWTLQKSGDGRWTGTAADVVGEASGEISGNAFRWKYTLQLPVGDSVYEVQFDDWMYLMDDRTLLNRAVMSKFGVTLGEVTLFFRKEG